MKQPLHVSIWSYRDIRLVLPARAVSYAGDSIALVALMLRISDHGGPAAITALLLAFAVPTVAMIPFAGRIVDGYDSRTVLVWASLLQAAVAVGLAFCNGLVATLALVCVLQLGQAVEGPAWGALIPRIVGEELVGRSTGASQALIGVATLAGSGLGGVLVGWSPRGALLVNASTFTGLALIAGLVRTRRRPEPGVVRERGSMTAGLRSIFADDLLRILVPSLWVFILVGEAVNIVEVFLITDDLGLGPTGYGVVLAAQGAGAIAGAWLTGRLKGHLDRSRAVLLGMAGIGISCVLMGLAGNVVVLLIGAVAIGLASGTLNAAVSTLLVTRTAEERRGRVIAALSGTARACSLLALLLGGAAGAVLGTRPTFVTAGALAAVAAVAAAVLVLRSRLWTKDSAAEALSH
ncbi:putative MFS family arabinose efflux permease [Kribbella voronezhensis]|uniref:Putative MFS family arabinose efflux permease n=1 Tax=Kribbella voronezhensis TaxID=2512212 RepID=A0A4R7TEH7_9ACTN|nr:MFS transporter [Kribbella voronezhensis]TDU90564.1 putative MFS family arabinose efflux permease [Kribbella voronezhensis]